MNRKSMSVSRCQAAGLALAGVVSLATPLESWPAEASENDVRCTEIAFSRSVETRDIEAFSAFLDEDARFIGGSVTRGDAAIVEAWTPFFSETGPELVWRPYFVEVAASGDLALSRGPYRMRSVNSEGNTVESWGIYNSTWRKTGDGSWKILFDAGNQGENQVNEDLKALIEAPVEGCDHN